MNMQKLMTVAAVAVSVTLPVCADDPTWTGGAGDGQLGNPANWSSGVVPTDGNVLIDGITAATTLSNGPGSTFAPTAITFGDGNTAVVTIGGDKAIEGLLAVTNLSSGIHHVFSCEVSFADETVADILAASGSGNYVKYPGGMKAYTLKNGSVTNFLSGQVTLTKDLGDWAQFANIGLLWLKDSGTKLNITHPVLQGAGRNPNFYIESGTTVSITGDLRAKTQFAWLIDGTLEASGWVIKDNTSDVRFASLACSGYIKAYGIKEATSGQAKDFVWTSTDNINYPPHFILGAGGIPAGTSTMMHDSNSGNGELKAFFYAADDYTVAGSISLGYSGNANSRWPMWHVYTNDNGGQEGRTVTFSGTITGNTKHPCLRIYGCGTFHATRSISIANGVEVYDTATFALDPGVSIGKRFVLNGAAQLAVTRSGTVDLSGMTADTQIRDGATLGFNFTDRETAPVLKFKSNATVSGTVKVKVSAADGVIPMSRFKYQLTQGANFTGKNVVLADGAPRWVNRVRVDANGNIVLSVKRGIMILVK